MNVSSCLCVHFSVFEAAALWCNQTLNSHSPLASGTETNMRLSSRLENTPPTPSALIPARIFTVMEILIRKSTLLQHSLNLSLHFEGSAEQLDLKAPPQVRTCSGGQGTARCEDRCLRHCEIDAVRNHLHLLYYLNSITVCGDSLKVSIHCHYGAVSILRKTKFAGIPIRPHI